jgi:tetratricopeptide (TPR) repeat protein
MSGDLNVAVAAFTTDGNTTSEGAALAQDVARVLGHELPRLDPALQVEVRGPGAIGAIDGRSGESQARAAKRLAQSIGADIVVYGDLAAGFQGTRLQPAFYLNAAKLPSATTLGGGYSYGGPIKLPYALAVSPPARAQIRAALIHRTEAYAQAFIGSGYYLLHALPRAELHLQHALVRAPTPAVAALLRLLLGNIADQQGHTDTAVRDYSLATHDATVRRRAQLGLADVRYQTGHKHCRPGEPSLRLLRSAWHGFSTVLHALGGIAVAKAGSPLAVKAAFGKGQVDLCLSAAGHGQRWGATRREFTATIAAYRPSLPELRDDAAEAHAGLGLYYLSVEQAPAAYEDARHEYSVAADLTTLRSRRAYFDGAIGFADAKLGDYSAAVVMYEKGARLAASTRLARLLTHRAERLALSAGAGE